MDVWCPARRIAVARVMSASATNSARSSPILAASRLAAMGNSARQSTGIVVNRPTTVKDSARSMRMVSTSGANEAIAGRRFSDASTIAAIRRNRPRDGAPPIIQL